MSDSNFTSPLTCSVDGCIGAVRAKGLCSKHYMRLNIHGSTDLPAKTLKDCVGVRFGRLVAQEMIRESGKDAKVKCLCDCGSETIALMYNLKNGNTSSCGCIERELRSERGMVMAPLMGAMNKTHGLSKTPTYISWCDAKKRCYNPANKRYQEYGGRGISMCDEWRYSFENFYRDMGEKPHNLTLERLDVNLGYAPGNCVWADKTTQARNTRANVATMEIAREIRIRKNAGETIKQLSKEFCMSCGNISQIVSHATWKEVGDAL